MFQVTTVTLKHRDERCAPCPNACWRPLLLLFWRSRPRREAWTERRTSNGGLLRFRTSEPLSNIQPISFFRLGDLEKASVSGLRVLMARLTCPSTHSRNEAGETPATYLRHNLRMDRSALDYTRIARSFFAISSERDGVILYSRCNFSKRGRGAIHCFDLVYPQEEKRSWDAVVTRISLSLRPLEG